MMAMEVGPLMGVNDPGKVRNRQAAKSRIFLIIVGTTRTASCSYASCSYEHDCCIPLSRELFLLSSVVEQRHD